MDKLLLGTKTSRRKRSVCSWKRNNLRTDMDSNSSDLIEYPPGPIKIVPSWNPVNRQEKPPYSYATIIGHAILASVERKLTLHEIYVWITENYPFYTNESQGWQNSIRHNLSLHKSFVKIDRDAKANTPPRKGCYWTIKAGKEQFFIDNLQKPVNSSRRQEHSMAEILSSHRTVNGKREVISRRTSSTATAKLLYSQQHQRQYVSALSSSSGSLETVSSLNSITKNGSRATRTDFSSTTSTATITADNTSSTLNATPESEPHTISTSSSSSSASSTSSDHLSSYSSYSSSSSSPITNSPTYHQLLCNVPETISMSYSVYPEHSTELFGDQHNDFIYPSSSGAYSDNDLMSNGTSTVTTPTKNYYYNTAATYFTTDNSSCYDSHPPSLSPCDGCSTTSSFPESQTLSYPHNTGTLMCTRSPGTTTTSSSYNNHYRHHRLYQAPSASAAVYPLNTITRTRDQLSTALCDYNRKIMLPSSDSLVSNGNTTFHSKLNCYHNELKSPYSIDLFLQPQQSPFLMDSHNMYGSFHR